MTQLELPFPADTTAPATPARFRRPEDVPWEHYEDNGEYWMFYIAGAGVHLTVQRAAADPENDTAAWSSKDAKGWDLIVSMNVVDHHEDMLLARTHTAKQARDYAWRRFMQDFSASLF